MSELRKKWTSDELLTAKAMYDNGAEYSEIGAAVGRSADAAYAALHKHFRLPQYKCNPEYFDGPPIGLTPECTRYRKDCKLGSEILQGMVMDLLNRMSPGEVADVLGLKPGAPVPGTERPYISPYAFGLAA